MTTTEKTHSIRDAAQWALDAQNACNLSGIVRSFARITDVLWEHARAGGHGTTWVNTHPISRLFAEQIAHLTKTGDDAVTYCAAYEACERLASTV